MDKSDLILYGALGVGAFVLVNGLTGNKLAENTGQALGGTASGIVGGTSAGIAEGLITTTLIKPYEWSQEQKTIPIIDWVAEPLGHLVGLYENITQYGWDSVNWAKPW